MSAICGPTACRGALARAEEGQNEFSPNLEFFGGKQDRNHPAHDDALLITLRIGDYDVKRVMVDGGSAVEVMYPQGAEFETGKPNALQLFFDELQRETCYSKGHN